MGSARAQYQCAVQHAGHWLSRVFRILERLDPQLTNTVVVVAGDHGESFGEHGFQQHGTSLHNEAVQVPFWLAGGPIEHAKAAGHLKASRDGGLPGVHRLEDIRPTLLDLMTGCLWRQLDPEDAQAEAAQAELYERLETLNLGGRSMLGGLQTARALLLMGMYGERKLGLVQGAADGSTEKATFTWEGCGWRCKLLDSQLHNLDADADELAPLAFGVGAGPRLANTSLPAVFDQAMGLVASLSSLHLHMRAVGVAKGEPVANHTRHAIRTHARRKLIHANDRLRSWLTHQFEASTSDGRLKIQLDARKACVCDPSHMAYNSCAAHTD